MALTKVTGQVVNTSTDLTVGVLTATTASFTGNVSVGGTLTYEDVTNVDSVGLITARNGIEVTDKGVQVGTGATVDSAAANTLTFLTNGSERIRVTSDGKVGINTDMGGAPASLYPFSVYRSTGTGYVYTETAQSGASAGLRAKAGTSDFTIFTTQGTGQLAVYDNTNTAERLRVDSSGNFGLGTTSPNFTLDVNGSVGITEGQAVAWHDGSGNLAARIYATSGDEFRFERGSSAARSMTIDSSGRLLLGASSSVAPDGTNNPALQVNRSQSSALNASIVIREEEASTSFPKLILNKNRGDNAMQTDNALGSVDFYGDDSSSEELGARIQAAAAGNWSTSSCPTNLIFSTTASSATSPSERMRIDSSGNVGIKNTVAGTIDAVNNAGTLVVGDGSSAEGITIYTSDSTAGELAFADATSGSGTQRGRIIYAHGDNSMRISTNGAEVVRIDSSGRLLVGNTSTSNSGLLCVKGSASDSTGGAQMSLQRGQSVSGANQHLGDLNFGEGSANTAQIRAFTDANWTGSSRPTYMTFTTTPSSSGSPTERMRIDSSGRLLLGTTTEGQSSADNFTVADSGHCGISIRSGTSSEGAIYFSDGTSGDAEYRGQVHYDHDGDKLRLSTAANTRLLIDGDGKIGIGGLTNPGDYHANANSLVSSGGITLANTTQGSIYFADSSSGTGEYVGQINYIHSDNRMEFITNNGERMRMTSDGCLVINGSSVVSRSQTVNFQVGEGSNSFGIQRANSVNVVELVTEVGTTTGRNVFGFKNPNGTVGTIQLSGSATSYNTSSDYRLKENIVDLDGAITRVKQLQPRRFNFIADDTTTVDGFVAHEAATVVPEAVTGTHNEVDDDGNAVMQGIDQSKLVPLLTAALQEAIAEIETLKTKVAALEG